MKKAGPRNSEIHGGFPGPSEEEFEKLGDGGVI